MKFESFSCNRIGKDVVKVKYTTMRMIACCHKMFCHRVCLPLLVVNEGGFSWFSWFICYTRVPIICRLFIGVLYNTTPCCRSKTIVCRLYGIMVTTRTMECRTLVGVSSLTFHFCQSFARRATFTIQLVLTSKSNRWIWEIQDQGKRCNNVLLSPNGLTKLQVRRGLS